VVKGVWTALLLVITALRRISSRSNILCVKTSFPTSIF
jgi:hypothetical protein